MTKLSELASLIRSKNAGPFQLTFDVMFADDDTYRRVRDSGKLTREVVARLYNQLPENVLFFAVDNARAIKISIPRPIFQGDIGDSDSHGGQQYPPLMSIDI